MRKCPLLDWMQALALPSSLPAEPSVTFRPALIRGLCHQPGPPEPGICLWDSMGLSQHQELRLVLQWSSFQNNRPESRWYHGRILHWSQQVQVRVHTPILASWTAQASVSFLSKVIHTVPDCVAKT